MCVCYINYTSDCFRYQTITHFQSSFCHGHSCIAVLGSVIREALACCCNDDLNLLAVFHCQASIYILHVVIAFLTTCKCMVHHLVFHWTLTRIFDASFNNCPQPISTKQSFNFIARIAMTLSIIFIILTVCCDRYILWCYGQGSGLNCDAVFLCHIHASVHHLVAVLHRVVTSGCIRYICHGSGRFRYQVVSFCQTSFCYRHSCIAVLGSVIWEALACCCDGDLNLLAVFHCQASVYILHSVVAFFTAGECMAYHLVFHRTLIWVRDASLYHCTYGIRSYHSGHFISIIAVWLSIIAEAFACRCDRYFLWCYGQGSGLNCDAVFLCHIHASVHHLVAVLHRVVTSGCIRYICHGSGRFRYQVVSFCQTSFCYRHSCIAVLGSVIWEALACCCDGDLNLLAVFHCQASVYILHSVVAFFTAGECMAYHLVFHRTLIWVGDASLYHCTYGICSYHSGHFISIIAVWLSIIAEVFACRCDRYFLWYYA